MITKESNIILLFVLKNIGLEICKVFIEGSRASYNYQALEALHTIAISKRNWDKLTIDIPKFQVYTGKLYRNAMIFQRKRMAEHFMLTTKERYDNLLNKHDNLIERVNLKNIASYLGVTPECISKLRKKHSI